MFSGPGETPSGVLAVQELWRKEVSLGNNQYDLDFETRLNPYYAYL